MSNKKLHSIPVHRFKTNDVPFSVQELGLKVSHKKNDRNKPHRHNYYEIFIFTKGGGTHMIDFKAYPIQTNTLHFISPGMVHSINRDAKCKGLVITFTDELYSLHKQQSVLDEIHLYHKHHLSPIIKCNRTDFLFLKGLINAIILESKKENILSNVYVLSLINSILIFSNRKFMHENQLHFTMMYMDERVQKFRRIIDSEIEDKLTVSTIANQLRLTPKQLHSLLKQATGLTPLEHINNRLLIEAKRLLVNTDLSAKEISFKLFFDDPAYFGRFFKKLSGYTPNSFRNYMRKKYQS